MRKEEQVHLLIEQTHPDGTTTQEEREYEIKVSYDAWVQAARTNMLGRGQDILQIKRNGVVTWRKYQEDTTPAPKSNPLF